MADNTYFFVKEEGGAKKRKMEVEDELERRRRWEMGIRKESERAKMQALVPMDARFNEGFQLYYRTQLATLLPGGDFAHFIEALRHPSPMTLRIQQTRPQHVQDDALSRLRSFGGELRPLEWCNTLLPPAKTGQVHDVVWTCSHDYYKSRPDVELWARNAKVSGQIYFQVSSNYGPFIFLCSSWR